jgi:hypothetical protein
MTNTTKKPGKFKDVPHHATKTYGGGGIVPRILNLCTRYRWDASFKPCPFYPWRKSPSKRWIRGWAVWTHGEENTLCLRRESSPCYPACSLIIILTELSKHWTSVLQKTQAKIVFAFIHTCAMATHDWVLWDTKHTLKLGVNCTVSAAE